jgi:competence protein CoiA
MHHWAHHRSRNCDPWWKNETPWHRKWKNLYPIGCREVSHTAEDGEIHRADVKTPTGIVIELQHSVMSDDERISRENFYQNLVWVLDGSVFVQNFDIYHMLLAPDSVIAQDIVWSKAKRHMEESNMGLFFRVSEAREEDPLATKVTVRGGSIHSLRDIEEEVALSYRGHHQYGWVRPRKTWLEAKCPVYIDFGDEHLAKLCTYNESGLQRIQFVAKRKFLHDSMHETRAEDIATKFYPLP